MLFRPHSAVRLKKSFHSFIELISTIHSSCHCQVLQCSQEWFTFKYGFFLNMNIVNDLFLHIWVLDPDSEDVIYTLYRQGLEILLKREKREILGYKGWRRGTWGGKFFKIIFAKTHPEIMHPILIIRLLHYLQSSCPPT